MQNVKKQTKKHQKAINDFKTNKCGYLFIQYVSIDSTVLLTLNFLF